MVNRAIKGDSTCCPGTEIEGATDADNLNYKSVSQHPTTTSIKSVDEHVENKFFKQDSHVGATSVPMLGTVTANTATLLIHHQLHKSNSDVYENI